MEPGIEKKIVGNKHELEENTEHMQYLSRDVVHLERFKINIAVFCATQSAPWNILDTFSHKTGWTV